MEVSLQPAYNSSNGLSPPIDNSDTLPAWISLFHWLKVWKGRIITIGKDYTRHSGNEEGLNQPGIHWILIWPHNTIGPDPDPLPVPAPAWCSPEQAFPLPSPPASVNARAADLAVAVLLCHTLPGQSLNCFITTFLCLGRGACGIFSLWCQNDLAILGYLWTLIMGRELAWPCYHPVSHINVHDLSFPFIHGIGFCCDPLPAPRIRYRWPFPGSVF